LFSVSVIHHITWYLLLHECWQPEPDGRIFEFSMLYRIPRTKRHGGMYGLGGMGCE